MCACAPQGGEKEYYLASACKECFVPPTAGFSLRGFKVAGPSSGPPCDIDMSIDWHVSYYHCLQQSAHH